MNYATKGKSHHSHENTEKKPLQEIRFCSFYVSTVKVTLFQVGTSNASSKLGAQNSAQRIESKPRPKHWLLRPNIGHFYNFQFSAGRTSTNLNKTTDHVILSQYVLQTMRHMIYFIVKNVWIIQWFISYGPYGMKDTVQCIDHAPSFIRKPNINFVQKSPSAVLSNKLRT